MSNRQKSSWRKCIGRKAIRRIETLLVVAVCLLRVDSAQWFPSAGPVWTPYATSVGRTERVTLQDGSRIVLNTDSEIKVRFVRGERQIVLLHGEALFTVVHCPDWPLWVRAGVTTIRAVGTKFSVRLRNDNEAEVLVIEGRIAIEGGQPRASERRRASTAEGGAVAHVEYSRETSPFPVMATAGELLSVSSTTVLSRVELPPVALVRRTAWTDGWIWFAKDPLPEAAAEFNRYHRQHLVLVDPALASLEIGGRFRSADLDSFIATLEHSFNVQAVPAAVPGTADATIYLTGRCERAKQQCNWPMVQ